MATNVSIPAMSMPYTGMSCPSCAAGGIRSLVKMYQINMEEAAVLCENALCPFPLFSQDVCPLVVSHVPVANSKFKTRSLDTESMTSTFSGSSWASHGSTINSISSSVATPPPSISSKSIWPSSEYSIYQPQDPRKGNCFDWITQMSSSQSSPANSTFSINDREVEMVMDKATCSTSNSGMTPSPSPTLEDILEAVGSQPLYNNDSYAIDSLSSFLDELSEEMPPTFNLSVNEKITNIVSDSRQTDIVTELFEATVSPPRQGKPASPATTTPVCRSTKRSSCGRVLNESSSNSLISTPSSMAAWENIELPKKRSSLKKPQPSRVEKSRASSSATSSDGNASSSTPTPQRVTVNMNEEGNHVFTIAISPATTQSPSSTKKTKATGGRLRTNHSSKTNNMPKAVTVEPPTKRTKKEDLLSVKFLTNKFIEAAKNKRLLLTKRSGIK